MVDLIKGKTRSLIDALALAWQEQSPLSADEAKRLSPDRYDEAYEVQAAIGKRLNWWPTGRPHGWKLAMGNPPKAAPIPDGFYQQSPARLNNHISVAGVEVELAVRLSSPLPAGCSIEESAAAVGETLAVIEGFDVRADNWRELPLGFLLADLQMHGGLFIGGGVSGWIGNTTLTLELNGLEQTSCNCKHPLSDPLSLLPWLADHAASRGWPLQAGDLVATGSWCGMIELPPASGIVAKFDGVGEVALYRASDQETLR